MNREIKFRGKSLNTGLWSYGDLRQDNIRRKAYVEYEVDPNTIGQFTGLTDCKGKEIYEGDILSFTVFDAFGGDRQYRGSCQILRLLFYDLATIGWRGLFRFRLDYRAR